MPDELTPHEKKIIEEAIQQGKVQQIPRGKSGIRLEDFSYKEYYKRQTRRGIEKSIETRRAIAMENERKIRGLLEEGKTIRQISDLTGLHENTVKRHARAIGNNQ
jgi:DNA-binding NarL/FixJ family response regulator